MQTINNHIHTGNMNIKLLVLVSLFGMINIQAQDITFSFDNAEITAEGGNEFYEADIMITSSQDFMLGSGQLYFNYSNAAFGNNVSNNGNLEITYPSPDYICGEKDNVVGNINLYGPFIQNDNTDSRFSFAFRQAFGDGSFGGDNVTSIPKKLFHIKILYVDSAQDPMITFETQAVFLDQFYTACGPSTPLSVSDCISEPGNQLLNDFFDSSESTPDNPLSVESNIISSLKVYPNPATDIIKIENSNNYTINSIECFDLMGKKLHLNTIDSNLLDVSALQAGLYTLKIHTEVGSITEKIVIQ